MVYVGYHSVTHITIFNSSCFCLFIFGILFAKDGDLYQHFNEHSAF